uniref:CCHC-type domain-containing protein n=1 Tax=Tanacetum cinerariifolium TaxID=118510 RepID=A0A6L2JL88_TANCI|nr:hypothetical protein [Tanacetum cinerariifolium]
MQTQTSNTLHNAIMEAGSKDRPPMLAPGNYVQWKSRIKRYIDTKPNNELIHYCLTNPPYKLGWIEKEVLISKGSPITRTEKFQETYKNVSQDIRDQLNAKVEAVQIILTGIDNDIYSTVDACPNAFNEIRAERIARVANPLALVAQQQPVYHPQNHPTNYTQNSSTRSQQAATKNRGKEIVNSSQPIYDQEPSMVAEDDKTSKDNEIDKLMALISLSFKKIYKPINNNLRTSSNTSHANQDNSPRINRSAGYENQRIGNVAGARETVGSTVVQKSRIQCYNCKEFGHVARECQKPKQVKDAAYHREKMLLCKQEEAGIQLNAEQADWRDDIDDDELEDQELEAHYMYMGQLQEVSPDAADSRPIFDVEPLEEIDQNDDDNDLANERELLASLIEKLKCEIDESKNRNKFLETSNKVLVEKLKGEIEDFKNKNKSLESSNNRFKEVNNKLSETNNLLYTDFKKSEAELARRNSMEYASKMEIKCAQVRGDFLSYKIKSQKSFNKYTQTINDLNQTILEMKDKLSAHQETIYTLSQQKEAQIKLYKTREDKELDKVIDLENKVKVLDNIVYKTGQSVQTMNMLNNKCRASFAKPEFLMKAQRANPLLYDIGCYNNNLAMMLAPEYDEVIRLEKESRSKLSDLIRPFDYDKLNNLYDLFVPQREQSSEQRYFSERSRLSHTSVNNRNSKESFNKQATLLEKWMDESIPWDKKCKISIEIFKVKMYVNKIFNGVELCKEKIARRTYSGYLDPFIQNTIEAKFSPEISRINAGLEHFTSVTNLQCDYLELLEKCECLENELSKSKMMSKSFEALQKHAINLEIDLQQCQEKIKNDKSFKENMSKEFRKEREQYFEIQELKAQLQDKCIVISELKKLIEKLKGKSVDTKFEKSSVIRQPNAFKSQRPSVLGKPTTFLNSFERKDFSKSKSVTQNIVSNDFSKPVTAQTLPPNKKFILKNTNVLAPGMYKLHTYHTQARTSQLPQDSRKTNKRVSFSTGVIPTTSVNRPRLKSNPMGDRVTRNNSQVKKREVEDQRRNIKLSKNKTFVTACNDNLNAKTLNVNSVCATCDKCVLNDKHDMFVLNSVAKPLKKTVASESNQKPRNITRKLHEHVSKTCSWWYPKLTPSGYKWKPKFGKENVTLIVSMPLGSVSRIANILERTTSRHSTVSNTPLPSNSFAARRDCPIHHRLWVLKAHDGKSQASN